MPGRVLVTGGAGFIGSHVCEALLAGGWDVSVYDKLSLGRRENVPDGVPLIEGDVRDEERLSQALKNISAVIHLAARVSVRDSLDQFVDDADVNLLGALHLLRACRNTGVRKFVIASSMAVYADSPTPAPINEQYRTVPISPYGIAKLAAEQNCLTICPQLGIEPVVLRLFNTFGPRQTFTPYVGVITIFIRKLLAGESPVIFGDGEQCRDFVYVKDVAAAFRNALESDAADCVLNIGTGKATSVNRIAQLLRSKINPSIELKRASSAPGELRNCVADITAAGRTIGYRPTATIEDMIEEVITHIKNEM